MSIGFGVGIQRLGSFGVSTLAALNAIAPGAAQRPTGFVYSDPTVANNGVYSWTGTGWHRERSLGDQIAMLTVTGGTANAISATAQEGIDLTNVVGALIIPTQANTGSVTINSKVVRDANGNALAPNALSPGKAYFLWNRPTEYRAVFNDFASIDDIAGLGEALESKADLDSPAFENEPTAPTPVATDRSKKLATTEFAGGLFDKVGSNGKRNLLIRTSDPASTDGANGDVCFVI